MMIHIRGDENLSNMSNVIVLSHQSGNLARDVSQEPTHHQP